MNQEAIEATIATAGSKATYTGSGASVVGWMMSNEFAVLVGLIVGVLGLVVNWWFKLKQDRREQSAHDLRMREMRDAMLSSSKKS